MHANGSIAFVTDASADVPLVERDHGTGVPWVLLPETWHAADGRDLRDTGGHHAELEALVLDGERPDPSEPSWDDFVAAYGRLKEVDRVFSIHSPASVSGAVIEAREAAGAYPNVRVIEANVTGIGLGLLIACARDLAETGADPDVVEAWLTAHRESVRMLVVPDRLDPTTSQRGLSARLLTGKPMLQTSTPGTPTNTEPGVMDRSRRLRSRRATVTAIERYFEAQVEGVEDLRIAVGHADAAGAVDPFLDLLERMRPDGEVVLVGRVGPRLLSQIGARSVAAAWLDRA